MTSPPRSRKLLEDHLIAALYIPRTLLQHQRPTVYGQNSDYNMLYPGMISPPAPAPAPALASAQASTVHTSEVQALA